MTAIAVDILDASLLDPLIQLSREIYICQLRVTVASERAFEVPIAVTVSRNCGGQGFVIKARGECVSHRARDDNPSITMINGRFFNQA